MRAGARSSARRDDGQIVILTALSMTAMLAIAALSIDVSYMYDKRNRMAAAADAGAKSAAIELWRNSAVSQTSLEAFANYAVLRHGFNPATTTTVTVNHGPTSGPYSGNTGFVEVIVGEPTATFFGRVLGWTSMTPRARAVAGIASGDNCIITLGGPTASPESFSVGNSVLTMPGCAVADDGDLDTMNPNAVINSSHTDITGVCFDKACPQANQTQGATPTSDPLSTLVAPTNPGGCISVNNPSGTLAAGCYSKISTTSATLTFGPGMFYMTGPILIGNHTNVTGSGVFFYFAGTAPTGDCLATSTAGCIQVDNNSTLTLSAMTSGAYTGILFFQNASDHLNAQFDGNSGFYNLSGASYFPGADVSFRNGLQNTNDCTLIIARSLYINNGNGSFSNTCSAFGGSPVKTVAVVE